MKNHKRLTIWNALLALGIAPTIVLAQGALLPQDCKGTPAQLESEKKAVSNFFRPGITLREFFALVDPSYVQHNPFALKLAAENHLNAYEEVKLVFTRMAALEDPAHAGDLNGPLRPVRPTPQPVIVTAECDLVTVVWKNLERDPTETKEAKYEVFGFDTFRVRAGKLMEHWDGAVLSEDAVRMLRKLETE